MLYSIYIKKKVIKMGLKLKNFIYKFYMYIFLLLIAFLLILWITSSFYASLKIRREEISMNSDYTNLNLYFLKTTKNPGVKIDSYGLVEEDLQSYYITFENNDGTKNTFIKLNDIIYYNKIKLCEDVDSFKVMVDKTGKESISAEIIINGKLYTSQYVIE